MTICAIAELLEGILDALDADTLNQMSSPLLSLAISHICSYMDSEDLENVDSLHHLWVKVMQNHRFANSS